MIESNVGIKIKIYNKWKGKKRSKKTNAFVSRRCQTDRTNTPWGHACMYVCMYVSGSDCVYLVKRGLVEAVINVVFRII